jgi:hypothetical protein
MELKERLQKDAESYTAFYKQLSNSGNLNDRLPNDGAEHDEDAEFEDLSRFNQTLEEEGSLSFME